MTDIVVTNQTDRLALKDFLQPELKSLLDMKGVDWTGRLLGQHPFIGSSVPIIKRKTREYALLIIAIHDFESALRPTHPKTIVKILAQLRLHYAHSELGEDALMVLLDDYVQDLKLYPADLIEQACIDYRKSPDDSRFFPVSGQLIKYIEPQWFARKTKLMKLKKLLEVSNQAEEELKKEEEKEK